jgi:glutamate formiminotransferase/formiminotetrahydrofolate cyclodeaminase
MGATDVCPFVPMQGATMEDCIESSRRVAKRVGEELGIPSFLYGHSAARPERTRLPDIRQGEYEALPQKMKDPDFAPDLNTRDRKLANRIAAELRETGKPKRGPDRKFVRDENGKVLRVPGRFRELQGGGWYIAEYGRVQISFNLMDFHVTSLEQVFDACREEAAKIGVRVTGSELVGLVPLEAILKAGDHYLAQQGRTRGIPVSERIHTAVMSLGLDDLTPFEAADKIVEYRYRGKPSGLKAMTLHGFADELSSDSPAPGGGSVAALCGSLSAALSAMVAALTWSKKGMDDRRPRMGEIGGAAQSLKDWFVEAVDADTEAFNEVLAARRLPKKTEEDAAARDEAIELANQNATQVPLDVLQRSTEALELALGAAREGLPASASDAGVAGACALAAAEGAALNVRINLPSITDATVAKRFADEQQQLLEKARELAVRVRETVDEVLAGTVS